MTDKYKLLREAIEDSIRKTDKPQLTEVDKATREQIWRLCEEGFINLGNEHALTSFGLECRVKQVFESMKFDVTPGRDGMEDLIVPVPDGFQPPSGRPHRPLVLEVKSSRKLYISRDDLRQLDDWVFELSGEEKARKHGLGGGGGIDYMAIVSHGMLTSGSRPAFHPSPHKGVLVFNGPIGTPFSARTTRCLGPNEEEFAYRRDFCIIPFDTLLKYLEECQKDTSVNKEVWNQIQSTAGLLSFE